MCKDEDSGGFRETSPSTTDCDQGKHRVYMFSCRAKGMSKESQSRHRSYTELRVDRVPIPSNLTIILQPSYPVRSSGFCATSSVEYDDIYPEMERIACLHPNIHLIWPSKVDHDAGKPLWAVERAVEVFETGRE
ncbi:uncharacterized protein BT62DRAFT_1078158 [Guyanagaster necrorhizus]|uniref:Uncharacterized protein n=1 Tax=Guyanagaster necrorhizus TaxID=856835 RepID=A0A9P8ARL9_9AGAR|nr:uncharacterized protein BT62DRAFT_1078158 [Guyanagaster necrorhizus MCA 3950]KAG7443992.1 hypothetical protein BT62DRAFT_1078158 [Guyanagaster necrorhizus MCA 3950]